MINGNSGAERTGSLSFLDPALKNELLRLDLDGLGITRISYDAETTGADTPARVRVRLYCEAIRLASRVATDRPKPGRARTTATNRSTTDVVKSEPATSGSMSRCNRSTGS